MFTYLHCLVTLSLTMNENWNGSHRSNDVTQTQRQRPESPMVTLTWHAIKYKVHKPHQKYILYILLHTYILLPTAVLLCSDLASQSWDGFSNCFFGGGFVSFLLCVILLAFAHSKKLVWDYWLTSHAWHLLSNSQWLKEVNLVFEVDEVTHSLFITIVACAAWSLM